MLARENAIFVLQSEFFILFYWFPGVHNNEMLFHSVYNMYTIPIKSLL